MTFHWWERIRDWVLLFGLLASSVILMVAGNLPMLRAFRTVSLDATAWVEARFAWAGGYLRALDENSALRAENIDLSSAVARSREALLENERLRSMLSFADTSSVEMVPARVVAKDITETENFLIIDRGSEHGVEEEMAVVDDRGIIGKVVLVADRHAKVMSLLNTEFKVPAKIIPLDAVGIVGWSGENRHQLLLQFVPRTEPVLRGQMVVTTGFSGVFPSGYTIGYVDSVATLQGRNELQVFVSPTAPVDAVEYVFVLKDRPDPAVETLRRQPIR